MRHRVPEISVRAWVLKWKYYRDFSMRVDFEDRGKGWVLILRTFIWLSRNRFRRSPQSGHASRNQ